MTTPREWIARGALALALLVLGSASTAGSLANAIVKVDPARAHALAPDNGLIQARYAEEAFSRRPVLDPGSLPGRMARRALLADPTAVKALTVLGFQAQLRGEAETLDRIFSYSTDLSRRELRPRIWAIEQAVTRGDIKSALRNYDIALRTSNDAVNMLYPTLTAALSEPRIRTELLPILRTNPVWRDSFIAYAAGSGIEPDGVIALFSQSREFGIRPTRDQAASLVNSLISENKPERAWAYYRSFEPSAVTTQSRDPNFTLVAENRAMFDWRLDGEATLGAAIIADGDSGVLDLSVPPSMGGVLVRQRQMMPVGVYRLDGRSRGVNQPDRSKPFWTLTCSDGRELGRVILPNSESNSGRFSGRFIVPQGCIVQTLALVARPSDDIMGVGGQIERAQLVRQELKAN